MFEHLHAKKVNILEHQKINCHEYIHCYLRPKNGINTFLDILNIIFFPLTIMTNHMFFFFLVQ